MTNVHIRPETTADMDAIHRITVDAFLEAPHTDHTEQFVVQQLRHSGALSISLVAEVDGELVGHVAISPVAISSGAQDWFGLGPISVTPAWQGKGIGSALMHHVLQQLKTTGAAGCVLLGDPAYYARFGFRPDPRLVLPDVPPAYFQALPFGTDVPQGVVTYHAAFHATH